MNTHRRPVRPVLRGHLETRPARLETPFLHALNDFRWSVMRPKPTTDRAADFEKFAAACRAADHVAWLRDAAGAICASFVIDSYTGSAEGRSYRLYCLDYAFVRADLRGHPAYLRLGLRAMAHELARWRGEALFAGGTGYPASVLALGRAFGHVHLGGDDDLPPLERALMARVVDEVAGDRWQADRQRMDMPTLPPPLSPALSARAVHDPLFHRYLARCPDWTEGYALACLARVRPLIAIAAVGLRLVRRGARPIGL